MAERIHVVSLILPDSFGYDGMTNDPQKFLQVLFKGYQTPKYLQDLSAHRCMSLGGDDISLPFEGLDTALKVMCVLEHWCRTHFTWYDVESVRSHNSGMVCTQTYDEEEFNEAGEAEATYYPGVEDVWSVFDETEGDHQYTTRVNPL